MHEHDVLRTSWEGGIPVEFVLDRSDVCAPSPPDPIFVMVPRVALLPLAARAVLERFREFAMDVGGGEVDGEVWFESNGVPLNWHLPFGVLVDLMEEAPRRIIVHLRSPPPSTIPRCSLAAARRHFFHSLKQALFVETGSTQRLNALPANQWDNMFEGAASADLDKYLQPNAAVASSASGPRKLPVRVVQSGSSFVQMAARKCDDEGNAVAVGTVLRDIGVRPDEGRVLAQGVPVSAAWNALETWRLLQAPDHFLYLVVRPG